MVLELPDAGLKLAHVPRPADPYKRDKIPQAVVLELPEDKVGKILKRGQDGGSTEMAANFGARASIELVTKEAEGKTEKEDISGKALESSLRLSENGYMYKRNSGAEVATLHSRTDLRLPKKKRNDEEDAGLLALTRNLDNAKAEKQSHRTTLAEVGPSSKRQKSSKHSLVAQLTGSNNLKAHRAGLFDRSKQASRSLNNSPNRLPASSPATDVFAKDSRRSAMEDAKKRSFVHLLAVRPVSRTYITKTLNCSHSDIDSLLQRFAQPSRLDSSKYELNLRTYKSLDPYGFNYPEEDREPAINRAIEAFDRMRLAKDDKEWQMLLPKAERGQGKCLSKLADKMLSADAKPPAAKPSEARSTTPVPEINVSEAGSPGTAKDAEDVTDSSRKRSSSDLVNTESQDRTTKRPKQASDPNKRLSSLFASQAQKEKERAKAAAKAIKEAQAAASKQDSKANSQHPSPKVAPRSTAAAKANAPAAGKGKTAEFKSAEFVTESDDEEAEAIVQKAKAKAAQTSTKPTASKPLPAVKSTAKPAPKQQPEKPVKKTSSTSTTEKPAKPSAWDFSAKAKPKPIPATATGRTPSTEHATSPRPSTPSSLSLHHRKQQQQQQVEAKRSAGVSSTKGAAPSPLQRPANSSSTKVTAKPVEKPASARTDLIRKLDSAKRQPGPDKNAKATTLKSGAGSARTDKPGAGALKSERSSTSQNGKATTTTAAPGTPGKNSESGKAPGMQKTFSHQRKSSSPLKPSPLAASPPINLSDMDEAARHNRAPAPAKNLPRKPVTSAEIKGVAKPIKRKADELDSKPNKPATSGASSTLERPVKRRETGTAVSGLAGATGSKPTAPRQGDGSSLKTRRYSQEESNNGNKSHSPSPASSTIGSTSTKGTSMSLLSSNSKERTNDSNKNTVFTKPAESGIKENTFKGYKASEVERMARFEEQREQYNRKQREVAAMEDPPIAKVRELNKLFHSLETQKKVLASLEHTG